MNVTRNPVSIAAGRLARVEAGVCAGAEHRRSDVDLVPEQHRGHLAERVADDPADAPRHRAHGDGHERRRADVHRLDRAGNRDQRQSERIEPQEGRVP